MGSYRWKNKSSYKLESKKFFNRVFDKKHGNSSRLHQYILEKISLRKVKTILDVGCGDGKFLEKLRKVRKGYQLYGLDISENMISTAKKKNIIDSIFQVGDSEYLPYDDNTFDLIFCLNSFHHYPDPIKVVSEFRRVLKPEGRVVIGEVYVVPGVRHIINLLLPWGRTGDYMMYSMRSLDKITERVNFKRNQSALVSPFLFISIYSKK